MIQKGYWEIVMGFDYYTSVRATLRSTATLTYENALKYVQDNGKAEAYADMIEPL